MDRRRALGSACAGDDRSRAEEAAAHRLGAGGVLPPRERVSRPSSPPAGMRAAGCHRAPCSMCGGVGRIPLLSCAGTMCGWRRDTSKGRSSLWTCRTTTTPWTSGASAACLQVRSRTAQAVWPSPCYQQRVQPLAARGCTFCSASCPFCNLSSVCTVLHDALAHGAGMIFRKEPFFYGHDNYDQLVKIAKARAPAKDTIRTSCFPAALAFGLVSAGEGP